MNKKSRLENSMMNIATGIAAQIIEMLIGLISRTVFIRCLSASYLGVNGLFSNILTMLSLAEMGLGSAILFNMYKPLANNDHVQVAKLMNLYRQAYIAIAGVVAVVGLCLTPYLNLIIKDQPDVPHLTFIYLLYLSNTVVSYLFAYRRSIFSADQKERVVKVFKLAGSLLRFVLQVAVLLIWKNFIAYLVIQIGCTFIENVCISVFADKSYPYLKEYRKERLPDEERKSIFENIKATFIYKFGSVVLNGTDNIIISAVNGVVNVGLLSNYSLLTGSVQAFLNIITHSITGSIGNFLAKEDEKRYEELLTNATFVNFVLYGVIFVGSIAVLNPFVEIWAGTHYLLPVAIVFVHCLNLFIEGLISTVWTFRSTMGLFKYGKWRPLVSAVINVVVSIWWGKELGLIGVLLGTTFTRLVTNVWFDPYIVYRYGIKKSPVKYYLRWCAYCLVIGLDIALVLAAQYIFTLSGLIAVLVYGCMAVAIFALTVVLIYHRRPEFKYSVNIITRMTQKVRRKR